MQWLRGVLQCNVLKPEYTAGFVADKIITTLVRFVAKLPINPRGFDYELNILRKLQILLVDVVEDGVNEATRLNQDLAIQEVGISQGCLDNGT